VYSEFISTEDENHSGTPKTWSKGFFFKGKAIPVTGRGVP
jgi:hypothetical protein